MAKIESQTHGLESDCLHCSPSDDDFTARMRFHQSWYRHHVLQRQPGPNPSADNKLYGNMLCEKDGLAGWNFISEMIHALAEDRLKQGMDRIEPNRLRNNLLSSQPMCFNLFGLMAKDVKFATAVFRQLPGLPGDLQITRLIFEYAPDKSAHLNDSTSFDAFAEYERPGKIRGFIGIETKLTEPFSQDKYEFSERYSRWRSHKKWWWVGGSEQHFQNKLYNQLWRNHLLGFAVLHQKTPSYDEGYCAVIAHPSDPTCSDAICAYRPHLLPASASTLLEWPISTLVECCASVTVSREQRDWINAYRLRYLGLQASQPAWNAYRHA